MRKETTVGRRKWRISEREEHGIQTWEQRKNGENGEEEEEEDEGEREASLWVFGY